MTNKASRLSQEPKKNKIPPTSRGLEDIHGVVNMQSFFGATICSSCVKLCTNMLIFIIACHSPRK